MRDKNDIQETINRYSEGASRRDWDQVLGTFLPDGVWEVPVLNMRLEGDAAIRAAMGQVSGDMAYFVQINAPATIKVDGDRATAVSGIRECGKYADRDEAMEVLGSYSDDLVRTADGWKFARRSFNALGMHNFPLSPAKV